MSLKEKLSNVADNANADFIKKAKEFIEDTKDEFIESMFDSAKLGESGLIINVSIHGIDSSDLLDLILKECYHDLDIDYQADYVNRSSRNQGYFIFKICFEW